MHRSLDTLTMDDSFVRTLPGDPEEKNYRRQVRDAMYSRVAPTPVEAPKLIALSAECARLLDLDPETLDEARLAEVFSGNAQLEGMKPYAACYGGHQFGNWAGQLGDGRAITLGEVVNQAGQRWELQLKGAGPTPYSRMGDGRAVMRSSVREFLCSEAMHHLGVPTTRALCLVGTGEDVVRDMFYDGNAAPEPGAIVCRVAPSFLRFGNWEIFAARSDVDNLRRLSEYAIRTHFPAFAKDEIGPEDYAAWLEEIARRTAVMVAAWMRVGFVHGVMNTDNMSVLGLTIDYGPYGWLEGYEPSWTPNTTDAGGRRYAYGRQPQMALWNLVRFANALVPLAGEPKLLEDALDAFGDTFVREQREMFSGKLGLDVRPEEDDALIQTLLENLQRTETDMPIFFRKLADVPTAEDADPEARLAPLMDAYYAPSELTGEVKEKTLDWLARYAARAREEGQSAEARRAKMNAANPKYVPRNYLAQLAIDEAEKGDGAKLMELLDVLRRPYDEQPGREEYAAKRPEWARHRPGCSMLSCSS